MLYNVTIIIQKEFTIHFATINTFEKSDTVYRNLNLQYTLLLLIPENKVKFKFERKGFTIHFATINTIAI